MQVVKWSTAIMTVSAIMDIRAMVKCVHRLIIAMIVTLVINWQEINVMIMEMVSVD
jgi:hypothetical protein